MNEPDERGHVSLEEAKRIVSDMARNAEGAERRWAVNRVLDEAEGRTGLPDPLTNDELVMRLSRLMRAAGPHNCQWAYRKAFPKSRLDIQEVIPKVGARDIPSEASTRIKKTVSLKMLYKNYPETKRGGFPPGYPRSKGLEAIKEWCMARAEDIEREREQRRISQISPEAAQGAEDDDAARPGP